MIEKPVTRARAAPSIRSARSGPAARYDERALTDASHHSFRSRMLKRFLLASLVGVVLSGILFARKGRAPNDVPLERAEPTLGGDGVTSVGSIRLWQDYDANEVAADNRYKGRSLRVTGRVLAVEKNLMGAAVLDLVSGNPIFRTIATLTPQDTPRAAAIAKGDTVLVQCTGGGSMMRMPQLEDCALLRPE